MHDSSSTQYGLIVDAGDFSAGNGKSNRLKTEYLLRGFMLLGYDAITLGERDFVYGARFLLAMGDKYQIPFVSANVYDVESGKPLVEPYLIKRFGDKTVRELKVGIFGLTMKNPELTRPNRKNRNPHLAVRDPIKSAKGVMKILKKEADIIICLAHIGLQQARTLAEEVPGIDVIVVGHGNRGQGTPLMVGRTRIVQAADRGRHVGDLTLYLDKDRKISGHKGILAPLDASYKDDPKLASLVAEYKKQVSKMKRPESTQQTLSIRYAGAKACKTCHAEQYAQWKETPHARAIEALQRKNSERNPECLSCHTTGFRGEGGFQDLETTPHLANVQCEACHGSHYAHIQEVLSSQEFIRPPPGPRHAICVQCHTSDIDPQFDFEEKVKKVVHRGSIK